ncbi:uncharacterized protein CIMG_01065 [Coccidioides immitis RS]|uniref:ABM domain-containing protein n=4 Tax=Coccidioides immitis TaxID=5501 RepID=J3KIC6_COCIM|nr:uncharacterized protein CIMG_01065 [Coccidioides immitis RS]KMP00990.1 hypothetical protein CIRG_01130 [Coccidioides immitis RMSCC 2394]KMU72771.1 hypothetical protein CISG_03205 [Coccidioides immitis RMSCC 3703]KMU83500.1 hypothetical protein CIHG_01282 [Coccidioides immitis H538.4]TPX26067.1 hypothetical protein DIZ76_011526 [Coccidioides immitis]EAS35711.3 hypothetical protein CIMG_01065 [Coccidioides immitis RS]
MTPSNIVTEFIYFTLKSDVKPEDRENDDGRLFLSALNTVKQSCGYLSSFWGRTIENENNIVWIIEWNDTTGCVPLSLLAPIIEPDTTPIALHTTLTPPPNGLFTNASVIELAVLAFPHDLSPPERTSLNNNLINFRSICLQLRESEPPSAFLMGWVERPGSVPHQGSESGKAQLVVFVVEWESKEQHEMARKAAEFDRSIAPIREKMLPPINILQMRHVKLQPVM